MSQVCEITASGSYVCGTGGWSGPKPGDPNTSDTLIRATNRNGPMYIKGTLLPDSLCDQ